MDKWKHTSNEDDPYQDDWDKYYEYVNESDEELEADTDEEESESESDENTNIWEIMKALTKTQEPEVLTPEQETQSQ